MHLNFWSVLKLARFTFCKETFCVYLSNNQDDIPIPYQSLFCDHFGGDFGGLFSANLAVLAGFFSANFYRFSGGFWMLSRRTFWMLFRRVFKGFSGPLIFFFQICLFLGDFLQIQDLLPLSLQVLAAQVLLIAFGCFFIPTTS